jgi:hypothetical protein
MDAEKLLMTWEVYEQRALWERELARAEAEGNSQHADVARVAMEQLREVDPVEALRANGDLVHLMVGRRWPVILDARERGASWTDIGEAMGMTAAQAWEGFRQVIDEHERGHGWSDGARARAILHDRYMLQRTADGWRATIVGRHGGESALEWKIAPADVSASTAQQRAAQLVWDLGRGTVQEWSQDAESTQPVFTASVTPR